MQKLRGQGQRMAFADDFNAWLEDYARRQLEQDPHWKRTDTHLAREMGVSQADVSRWKHGVTTPSVESCALIARFFGIPATQVNAAAGRIVSSPTTSDTLLLAVMAASRSWPDGDLLVLTLRDLLDTTFLSSKQGKAAKRLVNNRGVMLKVKAGLIADLILDWRRSRPS